MKSKLDLDRYYHQSSFPLVTFLFSKGEQVAGVNAVDGSMKKSFAFIKTPKLEGLVYSYQFGEKDDPELMVNVREYEQARRQLLDLLKNGNHIR